MEDRLKTLMHGLGNAINESLAESDRIAEAIGEIRQAGFDVFLVLEATIGFDRREDNTPAAEERGKAEPDKVTVGKTRFTTQDHRFLKALKIAVEEERR